MNFQEFLGSVKTKNKFASTKDFYNALSRDGELNMGLRNFQLLERGNQAPSFKAFASIFKKLDRAHYRDAVISFITSNLDEKEDAELISYIRSHLSEPSPEVKDSIWESSRPYLLYSETQMNELTNDPELMRLHHTLLLNEQVSLSKLGEYRAKVGKLVALELAELNGEFVQSSRALVRVPNYTNSPPSQVRAASKMLKKHMDLYFSLEGSPGQSINYAIQHLPKDRLKDVLDKMDKFKKWIQSMASPKTDDSVVPFVYLSWGKALSEGELASEKKFN